MLRVWQSITSHMVHRLHQGFLEEQGDDSNYDTVARFGEAQGRRRTIREMRIGNGDRRTVLDAFPGHYYRYRLALAGSPRAEAGRESALPKSGGSAAA